MSGMTINLWKFQISNYFQAVHLYLNSYQTSQLMHGKLDDYNQNDMGVSVPDFAAPNEHMLKLRDLSILLRKKLTKFSKINK